MKLKYYVDEIVKKYSDRGYTDFSYERHLPSNILELEYEGQPICIDRQIFRNKKELMDWLDYKIEWYSVSPSRTTRRKLREDEFKIHQAELDREFNAALEYRIAHGYPTSMMEMQAMEGTTTIDKITGEELHW
jgi:hypothetical protein